MSLQWNEQTRAWLYRIALALGAVAIAYGWITDDQADVWLQVIAAVLLVGPAGLAAANTSTSNPDK
ncbi:MAG: hypothetical protein ACF8PN_04885 [Phycisphaerales bacterium]